MRLLLPLLLATPAFAGDVAPLDYSDHEWVEVDMAWQSEDVPIDAWASLEVEDMRGEAFEEEPDGD